MKWLLASLGGAERQAEDARRVDLPDRQELQVEGRDPLSKGRAIFKSPHLAYLDFWKIKTAQNATGKLVPVPNPKDPKKRLTTPNETIVCGENEVWQYLYDGQADLRLSAGQGATATGAR